MSRSTLTCDRVRANSQADVIKLLDIKALPYVLFLIVPVLGRMSDPDEHVRLLSTSTFASLIKMVPLEVSTGRATRLYQE